jgi:hypothetical protein
MGGQVLRKKVVIGISFSLLSGCAAVNPNPNVGMRSTDLAYKRGDCAGAMSIAEPAALRGEPWAQLRMGLLLVDRDCPKPPPDKRTVVTKEALRWWREAACYQSKTDWERGSELAIGPSGYFNARASSTNAANQIADFALRSGMGGGAWMWINHALGQYEEGHPSRSSLLASLRRIESSLSEEQLAKIKAANPNPCSNPQG